MFIKFQKWDKSLFTAYFAQKESKETNRIWATQSFSNDKMDQC